jgi:chemotaxis protein methyltransferase CheR
MDIEMHAAGAAAKGDEREFPFQSEDFDYLASLVYDQSGIVLGKHKENMVYSRLARRLRELRLTSFREYCRLIQGESGQHEIGFLINAVTTNLTKFFRENHHFEHLRHTVLKDLITSCVGGERRLRIWSAGCSSGEEPYSIAMTVVEGVPGLAHWDARILATDLDSSMVAKAKAGSYSASAFEDVPKGLRGRYFRPDRHVKSERWTVTEPLQALITFKQLNLLGAWPIRGPFDAIFCRNVMIYFDAATKATLVSRFAELLKPHGWLYVGHSESLLENQPNFKLRGRTIYQKIT